VAAVLPMYGVEKVNRLSELKLQDNRDTENKYVGGRVCWLEKMVYFSNIF
jgi:hypothetical protein